MCTDNMQNYIKGADLLVHCWLSQHKPTLTLQKKGAAGGLNSEVISVILPVQGDVCLISRYVVNSFIRH